MVDSGNNSLNCLALEVLSPRSLGPGGYPPALFFVIDYRLLVNSVSFFVKYVLLISSPRRYFVDSGFPMLGGLA